MGKVCTCTFLDRSRRSPPGFTTFLPQTVVATEFLRPLGLAREPITLRVKLSDSLKPLRRHNRRGTVGQSFRPGKLNSSRLLPAFPRGLSGKSLIACYRTSSKLLYVCPQKSQKAAADQPKASLGRAIRMF